MADYFCDSSALVKRYVVETGSVWIQGIVAPGSENKIFIAGITGVEVISAVTRRERRGEVTAGEAQTAITSARGDFVSEYFVTQADAAIVSRAMDLAHMHGLRGFDAVQLATALAIHAQLNEKEQANFTFVSADLALNAAAAAEGLTVDDPNAHP